MIRSPTGAWLPRLMPLLVAVVTFLVFLPSLWNNFVTWDDIHMFVNNPDYRGLRLAELRWMWATHRLGEYMPVTWMSYGADYLAWGLDPFGYHLTNVLLHTLAALAVYLVGLRLLGLTVADSGRSARIPICLAAGLSALVFSIHPLRAEPVAWVSARGTVLGGLFLLLTVLTYLRGCAESGGGRIPSRWLAGALGLFGLALLSRATSVVLPGVLLVLDAYPLRRLGGGAGRWLGPEVRHVWWEKLPFIVLAVAMVPLAWVARIWTAGMEGADHYDPKARVAMALFAVLFYLKKTLAPGSLGPVYEAPPGLNPLDWPFLLSGVAVVVITAVLVAARRGWPGGLTAWTCYLTLLAPMSGVIPSGFLRLAADRYTYVSCVSWAILAGGGLLAWWGCWQRGVVGTRALVLSSGLSLVLLAGWGVASSIQAGVWRDAKTLWTHAVSVAPESAVAHSSLARVFENEGNLAEAVEHYKEAARTWPDGARIHMNWGRALARQGRLSEAAEQLQKVLRLDPGFLDAHVTLGVVFFSQGRVTEAAEQFETALRIDPGSAVGYLNLGLVLARQGRVPEAIDRYRKALELKPDFVEARANLDRALKQLDARESRAGAETVRLGR